MPCQKVLVNQGTTRFGRWAQRLRGPAHGNRATIANPVEIRITARCLKRSYNNKHPDRKGKRGDRGATFKRKVQTTSGCGDDCICARRPPKMAQPNVLNDVRPEDPQCFVPWRDLVATDGQGLQYIETRHPKRAIIIPAQEHPFSMVQNDIYETKLPQTFFDANRRPDDRFGFERSAGSAPFEWCKSSVCACVPGPIMHHQKAG